MSNDRHRGARHVGALALAASGMWTVIAIMLFVQGARLADFDETAAPPLGLVLYSVVVPVVLAGAANGFRLGVRSYRGDDSSRRTAIITFAVYLVVAIITIPGSDEGGAAGLIRQYGIAVVSPGPLVGLLVAGDGPKDGRGRLPNRSTS